MKNLFRFLFSIGGTLLCMRMANALTVTVTDGGAPHSPITRFQNFSTTLSTSVQDAPTSNEEVEVAGPYYEWSGSGSGTSLSSKFGSTTSLNSSSPVNYQGAKGAQNINISCTATYTRKDKKTGEQLSPISATGSTNVKFFIRVPEKVKWNGGKRPAIAPQGEPSPWKGVYGFTSINGQLTQYQIWGAGDFYSLELRGNDDELYAFGRVREGFQNASENPDERGPSTWDAPTWEDYNKKSVGTDPNLPDSAIWLTFTQTWDSLENNQTLALNSHYMILRYQSTQRVQ